MCFVGGGDTVTGVLSDLCTEQEVQPHTLAPCAGLVLTENGPEVGTTQVITMTQHICYVVGLMFHLAFTTNLRVKIVTDR